MNKFLTILIYAILITLISIGLHEAIHIFQCTSAGGTSTPTYFEELPPGAYSPFGLGLTKQTIGITCSKASPNIVAAENLAYAIHFMYILAAAALLGKKMGEKQ